MKTEQIENAFSENTTIYFIDGNMDCVDMKDYKRPEIKAKYKGRPCIVVSDRIPVYFRITE